ncbi:MAG: hypothetical protein CME93_04990 [Hyphomonadaceae bacterium]|nr:hypothetical protein [Hyphomonadaceae bacterium]OUX94723.1 MAG: hypothetical protein CBB77_06565 [Hyphomonas sp. TMED17]
MFTARAGCWSLTWQSAWTVERWDERPAIGLIALKTTLRLPAIGLGWILWQGFDGAGYALEVVRAARFFALEFLQLTSLLNGIDRHNKPIKIGRTACHRACSRDCPPGRSRHAFLSTACGTGHLNQGNDSA